MRPGIIDAIASLAVLRPAVVAASAFRFGIGNFFSFRDRAMGTIDPRHDAEVVARETLSVEAAEAGGTAAPSPGTMARRQCVGNGWGVVRPTGLEPVFSP